MNTTRKILFLIIVIALIGSTVISDTLIFNINSNDSDRNHLYSPSIDLSSADSIKINLKPIILLLCIGLIGLIVFDRRQTRGKENDKNIPS